MTLNLCLFDRCCFLFLGQPSLFMNLFLDKDMMYGEVSENIE
jgi:hypothetical protein